MIAKITLENFFSFGEPTTIELNPDVNILVGINGSGKSNFLKAIRLLYEGVVGEGFEKLFLRDWGGFDSVANVSIQKKDCIKLAYEFDFTVVNKVVKEYQFITNPIYEVSIYPYGKTGFYLKERLCEPSRMATTPDEVALDMENTVGKIYSGLTDDGYEYFRKDGNNRFKSSELILRQISGPEVFNLQFTFKVAMEYLVLYDYFDTTLKSQIRQPKIYGTENKLTRQGENLTAMLMKLQVNHSLAFDKLESLLENVNPHFKKIVFQSFGAKQLLYLREKNLAEAISIEHISDGTLRYLLLLSVLCNPERGGTVGIDEPEMGLHPDMINTITKAVREAGKSTQMIIATHSPLFLNAFELDEVIIFEKDENNQTIVLTKSEEDFENWNENYLTGQLWLQGHIGGKRW